MTKLVLGTRLLETLTNSLYNDPIVIFREYVQNSIDSFISGGRRLKDFRVDINIDKAKSTITITDNGYGIPQNEFDKIMFSISNSFKSDDMIGFKGIGRLSGMPFCEELIFESKFSGENNVKKMIVSNLKYLTILKDNPNNALEDTFEKMITIADFEANDNTEHYFKVTLSKVNKYLMDFISNESFLFNELSKILPVPYSAKFEHKMIVEKSYKDYFLTPLSDYQFNIYLNNKKIEKLYGTETKNKPIYFVEFNFPDSLGVKNKKIGIMWFTFDMVFKSIKNFGISVRSKNMLLSGGTIFAEVAAKSILSQTTLGQLNNGIKCIQGELLVLTDDLRDNSSRTWFSIDERSLFLRDAISDFMNKMHSYRYKASLYFNSAEKSEKQKNALRDSFLEFVNIDTETIEFNNYFLNKKHEDVINDDKTVKRIESTSADEIDNSPNYNFELDDSYSNEEKEIYRTIMTLVYQFLTSNDKKQLFFELYSSISQRMNQ